MIKATRFAWRSDKARLYILSLGLFNIVFHLFFYNNLEFHRDELLYFALGMHPAGGYATTPPLIGWLAYGLMHTLGYTLFSVKLLPAIGSGLLLVLTSQITRELGGKTFAQVLAAVGIIVTPIAMRGFFLFQPVFIDIFLWTLALFIFIRFLKTEAPKHLLKLGLVLGFGLLNKYLIALLAVTFILIILASKHRKIFKSYHPYLALILAVLIFMPNLIWQIRQGFPVFSHMAELNNTQLVHVNRIGFLLEQIMISNAAAILVFPGLVFLAFNNRVKKFRSLAWISLLVFIILLLLRGKSYYTAGIFPMLIAAGALFWEHHIIKPGWRITIIAFLIAATLPILPLGIPIFKAKSLVQYFVNLDEKYGMDIGRRWEDGEIHPLPQDYADMIGWEELTKITAEAYQIVENKEACLIYASNYGQAGAVTIIGKKYDLPEAFSFHDAFRYWLPKEFNTEITEFIYINDELGQDIDSLFQQVQEVGRITNPMAREHGTRVYLCKNPRTSFNEFIKMRMKEIGINTD